MAGQQGTGEHSLQRSESYYATGIVCEHNLHGAVAKSTEPVINEDRGENRNVRVGIGHSKKLTATHATPGCPEWFVSLTVVPSPSMIRSLSEV